MATTFVPDATVNSISLNINGASYNIGRLDGGWVLQGGNRPDLQNNGVRGDTFGEAYDVLIEYTVALAASETALVAEVATILPQPPPG